MILTYRNKGGLKMSENSETQKKSNSNLVSGILLLALLLIMTITSPTKSSHIQAYRSTSTITSQLGNFLEGEQDNYGNLFVGSYFKKGNYFSVGVFGKVFVIKSK